MPISVTNQLKITTTKVFSLGCHHRQPGHCQGHHDSLQSYQIQSQDTLAIPTVFQNTGDGLQKDYRNVWWQPPHGKLHSSFDKWTPRHQLDELLDIGGGRHLSEEPHGASERVELKLDGGRSCLHFYPGPQCLSYWGDLCPGALFVTALLWQRMPP